MGNVCAVGPVTPGKTVAMVPVTVRNPGPQAVMATVTDVVPAGARGWLAVPQVELAPGKDTVVPVTLHLPRGALNGLYVVDFQVAGVRETAFWTVGRPAPAQCHPGTSSGPQVALVFLVVVAAIAVALTLLVRSRLRGRL